MNQMNQAVKYCLSSHAVGQVFTPGSASHTYAAAHHPAKDSSQLLSALCASRGTRQGPSSATFPAKEMPLHFVIIFPNDSALTGHSTAKADLSVLGCCPGPAPRPSPQQLAYSPWFAGLLNPRAAGHFVLVRIVGLTKQNATPSQTAHLSGASPDFTHPKPLSGGLLIDVFSVQFQDFQALQALNRSYFSSRHFGLYMFLLPALLTARWCDPSHPARTPVPLPWF
jgi:hypothetical protein